MAESFEQEITAHEEQLARASQTLDVDALNRLYADDILMTNVLGESCDKSVLMDEARRGAEMRQSVEATGKPITSSYDKEDLKVMTFSNAAVTSYRFVITIKGPGIDVHRRYRTTNVWARRQEGWQVVAAHTAFVLDPQQAPKLAGEPNELSISGTKR